MYLQDITPFLGTGQNNEAGEDLQTFLEAYDPKQYDNPCSTVDIAVVTCSGQPERFQILMIRRKNHPSIGMWALPGGFVEMREDLETAAARELEEETSVTGVPLVQVKTYGAVERDPRTRIISVLYLALLRREQIPASAGDDAADALWYDVRLEKQSEQGETSQYLLTLTNEERGITLKAFVENTRRQMEYIRTRDSKVISTSGIAGDHAALITDTLLFISDAKNNSGME